MNIDQRRFGRRIALPSTAQIKHELRMLMAAETHAAIHAAMPVDLPSAEGSASALTTDAKIDALETLLAVPDVHDTPSPEMGMEMLKRGLREQQLANLKSESDTSSKP